MRRTARRPARGPALALAVVVVAAWLGSGLPAAAVPSAADDDDDRVEETAEERAEAAREAAREAAEEARAAAEQAATRRLRDAELELERARAALASARTTLQAAWAGGRAADGRVRAAEDPLPELVIRRLELAEELEVVGRDLVGVRASRAATRAELVTARDALAIQAVRTFKTGSAVELTGPVAVLREARDPGQLARGLADLRSLTRDGARSVRALEAELVALEERLTRLRSRRAELRTELVAADEELDAQEGAAAVARVAADGQEARVVAAMAAEVAADRALRRARQRLEDRQVERAQLRERGPEVGPVDPAGEARAGPTPVGPTPVGPTSTGPTPVGPEAADTADTDGLDERVRALEGRRRAHQRSVRLTASQRRTAADWACPVAGARFVNDWAFPRSGARRHQGTDVFADRGTPILAVASGTVTVLDAVDGPGDLGGITVTIADGDSRQYYAHLERIEAELRRGEDVRAGDRVGWVGTTGNARGTPPHLHLGWYVDDVAVNPFASLAVACDGDTRPALPTDVVPVLDGSDEVTPLEDEEPDPPPRSPFLPAGADQGWRTPSPERTAR